MNGNEREGLLLGVRSSLHSSNGVFPIGAHVAGKSTQTTNVKGARHLKDVRVGERAIGAGLEALTKLRTNVQGAEGIGEKRIRGRRTRALGQGLERSDGEPREVVTDGRTIVCTIGGGLCAALMTDDLVNRKGSSLAGQTKSCSSYLKWRTSFRRVSGI